LSGRRVFAYSYASFLAAQSKLLLTSGGLPVEGGACPGGTTPVVMVILYVFLRMGPWSDAREQQFWFC
jgi:hypothetical protein